MGAVLVTGGAGYIGSQLGYTLGDAGIDVVVMDDLSTGRRESAPPRAAFIHADVTDEAAVRRALREHRISAVVHMAGSTSVPESLERPLAYYANNVGGALSVVGACVAEGVQALVFSSTAAVYAPSPSGRVDESAATEPLTPYGASKLMAERIIADAGVAHGLRSVILRYFNVAGADSQGRTGAPSPTATHLITAAARAAARRVEPLDLFGTDYPTADGTCIRDFIHVADLAAAHLCALQHLERGGRSLLANCGYGRGASVREVLASFARLGRPVPVRQAARRPGDLAVMVADPGRLRAELPDWTPRHAELDAIVASALAWEDRRAAGR